MFLKMGVVGESGQLQMKIEITFYQPIRIVADDSVAHSGDPGH